MIYFITGNEGKLREAQAILGEDKIQGYNVDLPEIQEIDAHEIIKAKLTEAEKHQQGEYIVEDTSVYLDALNGLPGPLIKWFLKTIGNDGLVLLAEKYQNAGATAKTIVGYSNGSGEAKFFEGSIRGTIVTQKGSGFGWDPIFMPDGHNKTMGEMTAEEKNAISMRKIALEGLKEAVFGKTEQVVQEREIPHDTIKFAQIKEPKKDK